MMPRIKFPTLILAFVLCLIAFFVFKIATFYSLKSVLHRAGISSNQSAFVVYKTEEQGIGHDHLYFYCIQLERFDVKNEFSSKWKFGPENESAYSKAVVISGEVGESSKCFTGGGAPDTKNVKAFISSIYLNGGHPVEMDVYLFEPMSKRLLYVSFGT